MALCTTSGEPVFVDALRTSSSPTYIMTKVLQLVSPGSPICALQYGWYWVILVAESFQSSFQKISKAFFLFLGDQY